MVCRDDGMRMVWRTEEGKGEKAGGCVVFANKLRLQLFLRNSSYHSQERQAHLQTLHKSRNKQLIPEVA